MASRRTSAGGVANIIAARRRPQLKPVEIGAKLAVGWRAGENIVARGHS